MYPRSIDHGSYELESMLWIAGHGAQYGLIKECTASYQGSLSNLEHMGSLEYYG